MKMNYFIPMILGSLILIGVAFITGISVNDKNTDTNQSTNQLSNKIKDKIEEAIDKIDVMIQQVINKLVVKLPKNVKNMGENILEKGWNKIKDFFLRKIGAE